MLGTVAAIVISVVSFIVMLSIIVFIHEYGHFKVARLCGVKVDVFSIGFGKTLLRRTDRQGTEWRISALPLGGYVKFFGDAGPASNPDPAITQATVEEPKAASTQFPNNSEKERLSYILTPEEQKVCFHFKPVWQRMAVVSAGPIANFILGIAIFTGFFWAYGETQIEPRVGSVQEGKAADIAGVLPGDVFVEINGKPIKYFSELSQTVKMSSGEDLNVKVDRGGEIVELVIRPVREAVEDGYGKKNRVGFLGVGSSKDAEIYRYKYKFLSAVQRGTAEVGNVLMTTVKFLGRLITGKEDPRTMGGPVKIAEYAGLAAKSGFNENVPKEVPFMARLESSAVNFIQMGALISISIGFLNLLPIPVLDGGHLVFYAYEAVAGKPLDERIQAIGFRIGIVMLGALMIFVFYNDITQLIFPAT